MKNQLVAGLLIVSLSTTAQAEMVSTDAAAFGRERVSAVLQRTEIRERLEAQGIDAVQVEARVAALTDEEAAALAAKFEQLPAGGDPRGILAALAVAAVVYVVVTFWPVFVIGGVAMIAFKNADRS